MKSRASQYLLIGFASPLVLALAVLQNSCASTHDEGVGIGSLDRRAREAKRKGELAVEGGMIIPLRPHFDSLDATFSQFTVVLGVPVAKESKPSVERDFIETYYKVRILETLSEPARQPGAENFADSFLSVDRAPARLLPLDPAEVLVRKAGGTIVIDGVRITEVEDNFPDLTLSQTHLLFLAVESTRQVAEVLYGGPGVFSITGQRNLAAITARSNGLADELSSAAGNDLSRLRDLIRDRRPPD